MDPKVSNGHVTKEMEKQVLSDLSSFPLLAGMLAFEKKLKQNRCRNRETPEQKKPEVNNTTSCSTDHKVSSRHVSKEEECQVLSDLTGFPDVAAMMSFEKTWKENIKRQKTESEPQNSTSCSTGHKVSSRHVTKEEECQVLSDLTDFPNLAKMLSFEKAWKENKKRQKTESATLISSVGLVKVNNREDSSKERVHSQLVHIVNDVVEDRREESSKIRVNVPEEGHREDSSNDRVEPKEGDKPKDLGLSSVPFQTKPLEIINLTQLNEPSSELRAELVEIRDYVVHKKYPSCSTDQKVSSCHVTKEEARQQPQNSMCCPVDHKVKSTHVCKKDERQVLSDLTGFPGLAAMVSAEKALKEKRKRQKTLSKAQSGAVNTLEEKREESDKQRVGVVTVNNCEDSSKERVNGVMEDKSEDSSILKVNAAENNRENLSKERVNDVEEDKRGDSNTERVPCQPVKIVNDVVEDGSEGSSKRRVNVLEEEHHGDSSKDRVEPKEEDKPKDLGLSSVPFQTKLLEIKNLSQLNKPSSELRAGRVEMRDNVGHRKYPRGGRYFDDPERRPVMGDEFLPLNGGKKPKKCLLCGGRDHKAKSCKQVVDCFICYSRGHLESDCPKKQIDKDESETFCLKCGKFGHDMFSCSNEYSPDDLKQIQCTVCMEFGHLSCVDYMVEECKQVSCYKCGELGHVGSDCKKLLESFSSVTPRLFCFRCRQKGHHSRECVKRKRAPEADNASESIIPNLASIRRNNVVPSLNPQPKSG